MSKSIDAYRGDTVKIPVTAEIPEGSTIRIHLRNSLDSQNFYNLSIIGGNVVIPPAISSACSGSWSYDIDITMENGDNYSVEPTHILFKKDNSRIYEPELQPRTSDLERKTLIAEEFKYRKPNGLLESIGSIEEVNSAIEAEELRKSNETNRGNAETTRGTNETARQNQESTRQTNETNRGNAETTRGTNETARQNQEGTRQTNETNRGNAEATRGTNETARQNQESTRQTNETNRGNAETTRGTNESTRQTNETNRGTAETTRQNQESARQTAEAARVAGGAMTKVIVIGKNKANINDPDAVASNGKLISTNGVLTTNANYNTTGFIPVVAGLTYFLSFKHNVCWFNTSKAYVSISDSGDTNQARVAPVTGYMRCAVRTWAWSAFQAEIGLVGTAWESYTETPTIPQVAIPLDYITGLTLQLIKSWVLQGAYLLSAITYDTAGYVSAATITWPDGDVGSISNVVVGANGITSIRYNRSGSGKYVTMTATYNTDGSIASQGLTTTGI